jgi:hypothetical protein
MMYYSRTLLIWINWDGEPSGYAEDLDNWIFPCKLAVWMSAITIYSMHLRLKLSIMSDSKFKDPQHCTVSDPLPGYFKET